MKKAAKPKKSKVPTQPNPPERSNYEPDRELIAKHAYHIWEQEGRPDGKQEDHWHQAEVHLRYTAKE